MRDLIGLTLIIISLVLTFTFISNTSNDRFWHNRPYKLIEKNEGFHQSKGEYYADYYFTVKYNDDPHTLWTTSVSGSKYFSQHVNQTYNERIETKYFYFGMLYIILLLIIGCIIIMI